MSVMFATQESSGAYLMHFRTKGSKNGVRLYQNKDGSLTPLGRIHYGVNKKEKLAKKEYKAELKSAKNDSKAAKAIAKSARFDKKLAKTVVKSTKHGLSQEEWEQTYRKAIIQSHKLRINSLEAQLKAERGKLKLQKLRRKIDKANKADAKQAKQAMKEFDDLYNSLSKDDASAVDAMVDIVTEEATSP